MSAKIIEVIEVVTTVGCGRDVERHPDHQACRLVTEYYHRDGTLIARKDPCAPTPQGGE